MKLKLSCCLLAAVAPAFAESEIKPLEKIVVSATRTAQSEDETLASVTVLTREDFEKKQALSVQDALRDVPGISISNSGGLGKDTSIFMRGTESGHVLTLIDGVRVGSATLGKASIQDIPIDQIERIEIVRGPRSSLYGSEAIGGVIQIFTRKGERGLKPYISAGLGSYDTYKMNAGVSGGDERAWYHLSAGELYSHGINAYGGTPHQPDKDGYENTNGSARAGYRFENGAEVEANLLHAEGFNLFDSNFSGGVNRSKFVQQVVGGKFHFSPLSLWDVTFRAGSHSDHLDSFVDKAFGSRFNTDRLNASLQNDFIFAKDHRLTAGFDYYADSVASDTQFAVHSRDNKAGFVQYMGKLFAQDWILALRRDDNQQFGGYTTGSAGWGYSFSEALRLTASYGTAFKAPTFNDLYWPVAGNANLKPEQSESFEVGANGRLDGVNWSLNAYHTVIDHLIAWAPQPTLENPYFWAPANINKAEIIGLETQASTTLFSWDVALNLSLLDPRNRGSDADNGKLLHHRAQQMFRLDLSRSFGKFRLGLSLNEEGGRYNDPSNTNRLNGFQTVDLNASVSVYKGLTLEGRVSNLFDEHYQTNYLYNQMGTNLFISVNYRPEKI